MAALVTGCGGGGGGGSAPGGGGGVIPSSPSATATPVATSTPTIAPTATPTIAPTATPTAAPLSLTGTAADFTSGAPLANMTVTLGTLPDPTTCNLTQTQTLNVCANVASTLGTAKTASDGSFTVSTPSGTAAGTYFLIVGPGDGSYASLHRTVALTAGSPLAIGTVKLTSLSPTSQAWLADINKQRATVSLPTSFGNLTADEYATEQAQKWADDVAAGVTAYGDPGFAPYIATYMSQPGRVFGPSTVSALIVPTEPNPPLTADSQWFGEKANCPNGNWKTCSFASNTGHYLNLSFTGAVYVGLGYAQKTDPSHGAYPLSVLIVGNGYASP